MNSLRIPVYALLTVLLFTCSRSSLGQTVVWNEPFDVSTVVGSGGWDLNFQTAATTANEPNYFVVNDNEGGVAPPGCGTANNGDQTLHITSTLFPNNGAAYNAGGLCGIGTCVETHTRAQSPTFSTVGFTNLTLEFDYIANGEANADFATVWYNDGSGWTQLGGTLISNLCVPQGQWTAFSMALPATMDNNPNAQVGFGWDNDDNGVGSDPSYAVNNVQIITPSAAPAPVADFSVSSSTICAGDCIDFTDLSSNAPTSWTWTFTGAATTSSTLQNPTGICYNTPGTYDVTLSASNAAGTDDTTYTALITVNPCTTPVANFTASNTNICEGDCIDFTDLSTGSPTGWTWTFVGATPNTGNVQNPTSICYATAGSYDVTLSVSNANGTHDTTFVNFITVTTCGSAPTPNFSASNTSLCENDCIDFTDLTTGGATSWNWTFPGATTTSSTDQNPQNICYPTAGTYDVTLQVTNALGTSDTTFTQYITVTACGNAPSPNFSASNTSLCENDCIDFTDLSTGGATSWNWTFPGATTTSSTDQNPQNICYPAAGMYDVTLEVTNAFGTSDTTFTHYITVTTCTAPTAAFSVSDTSICSGNCVTFSDQSTGGVTSYQWTFPGGTPASSTDADPGTVCFGSAGTYAVELIVSNSTGSDTTTTTITVNASPAGIDAGDDQDIESGQTAMIDVTGGGNGTYQWTPSDGLDCDTCASVIAAPLNTTTYIVQYTENGCSVSDTVTVNVTVVEAWGIPNAFSPNGDGQNDVLYVRGNGISGVRMMIYNRYGQLVFESTDLTLGWDGTHKGKAVNPGVFVYFVEVTFANGNSDSGKGNVTLVR